MKRICCLLTAFPPAVLLSVCQPRPRRTSPGAKRAYERKLVQAQATDAPFPAALLGARAQRPFLSCFRAVCCPLSPCSFPAFPANRRAVPIRFCPVIPAGRRPLSL